MNSILVTICIITLVVCVIIAWAILAAHFNSPYYKKQQFDKELGYRFKHLRDKP